MRQIEEPFSKEQVGSSAMPHKRNPIHSERICGLARFLIALQENPSYTAATQWLERSLDDSANRRLCIPEAFLTLDALLNLISHVTSGLVVHPKSIEHHLHEELPFMATENILMESVKQGKDRQKVHACIKKYSHAASQKIQEGAAHTLLEDLAKDPEIGLTMPEIHQLARPELFIGRAKEQTLEFLQNEVEPLLKKLGKHKVAPTSVEI